MKYAGVQTEKIHGLSDFKIYGHMICRVRKIMEVFFIAS